MDAKISEKEFIMWLRGYLEGTIAHSNYSAQTNTFNIILSKMEEIDTPNNGKILLKERVISPYLENNKSTT